MSGLKELFADMEKTEARMSVFNEVANEVAMVNALVFGALEVMLLKLKLKEK